MCINVIVIKKKYLLAVSNLGCSAWAQKSWHLGLAALWQCGILVLGPEIQPSPLHFKGEMLTPGAPGRSQ